VLMLRPARGDQSRPTGHFTRMLLPLDGSDLAADILPTACDIARASNARIVLLRVVVPVPLGVSLADGSWITTATTYDEASTRLLVQYATRYLERVARTVSSEVESHVIVSDRGASAIIDFARKHLIDVVAMATHGRGASRLVVGSVADKVLRGTDIPVLLKRPANVEAARSLDGVDEVEAQLPAMAAAPA
jgi:nucleotide-binding universal stress UspA family protein